MSFRLTLLDGRRKGRTAMEAIQSDHPARRPEQAAPRRARDGRVHRATFLLLLHAIPAGALVTGTSRADWIMCGLFYVIGGIGLGIGLHRYFSHRSFRTSRSVQFLLATLAATAFGDAVDFAGKHRLHHRHADAPGDVHGPHDGFWYCWFGNLIDEQYTEDEIVSAAADVAAFPELMWLHRHRAIPGLTAAAVVWCAGGFSMFAIGFCLSRVLILNASSAVNFVCHRWGQRPYATADLSTNNITLAWLTFGEGWHNNHHYYPTAARAGFHWWQVDPLYWVLRVLAGAGLVWGLREGPRARAGA